MVVFLHGMPLLRYLNLSFTGMESVQLVRALTLSQQNQENLLPRLESLTLVGHWTRAESQEEWLTTATALIGMVRSRFSSHSPFREFILGSRRRLQPKLLKKLQRCLRDGLRLRLYMTRLLDYGLVEY